MRTFFSALTLGITEDLHTRNTCCKWCQIKVWRSNSKLIKQLFYIIQSWWWPVRGQRQHTVEQKVAWKLSGSEVPFSSTLLIIFSNPQLFDSKHGGQHSWPLKPVLESVRSLLIFNKMYLKCKENKYRVIGQRILRSIASWRKHMPNNHRAVQKGQETGNG